MRFIILLLNFFFVMFLLSAEEEVQPLAREGLISPLLSLDTEFPIDLSIQNREFLITQSLKEPQRNLLLLKEHTFPWGSLITLILIGIVGVLGRQILKNLLIKKAPKITPEQEASKALSLLQSKNLLEKEKFEEYYTSLSNIVRDYLEKSVPIANVHEQTTEEFLHDLPTLNFSQEYKDKISEFYQRADKVKFASYKPTMEENKKIYELTQELLELSNS